MPDRDQFLAEFLRLEGPGDQDDFVCARHTNSSQPADTPATFRCLDCDGVELLCHACAVTLHAQSPLHRIEVCFDVNGFYFNAYIWVFL